MCTRSATQAHFFGVSMLQPRSVGPTVFSSKSISYGRSRCRTHQQAMLQLQDNIVLWVSRTALARPRHMRNTIATWQVALPR